jgi:hypothetical protein
LAVSNKHSFSRNGVMVSEAYWAISISSFRLGDADSPDESSTEDEDEYIPKKKLVKKQGKNTLQSNLLHQLRLQSIIYDFDHTVVGISPTNAVSTY